MWTRPGYEHRHDEADQLVKLAAETGLKLLLPQGITTYERIGETGTQQTTIDLAWATSWMADRLVRCEDQRQWWNGADHVPILTKFDLTPSQAPARERWKWDETDWEAFRKELTARIGTDEQRLLYNSEDDIDIAVQRLIDGLLVVAEMATPKGRITGFLKPGYTPEMA